MEAGHIIKKVLRLLLPGWGREASRGALAWGRRLPKTSPAAENEWWLYNTLTDKSKSQKRQRGDATVPLGADGLCVQVDRGPGAANGGIHTAPRSEVGVSFPTLRHQGRGRLQEK